VVTKVLKTWRAWVGVISLLSMAAEGCAADDSAAEDAEAGSAAEDAGDDPVVDGAAALDEQPLRAIGVSTASATDAATRPTEFRLHEPGFASRLLRFAAPTLRPLLPTTCPVNQKLTCSR